MFSGVSILRRVVEIQSNQDKVFYASFKLYEDRDLSCFGISTVNMKTSFGCGHTFSTKHGDT